MRTKAILTKLQAVKEQLRQIEHELQDAPTPTTIERITYHAARQAVSASEAELQSAVFSLESIADLTNPK